VSLFQRFLLKTSALLSIATKPVQLRQSFLWRSAGLPISTRLEWDAIQRPHYAYGVLEAAKQAKALGSDGITAIEFGVAGGAGLICMEEHAAAVAEEIGLRIDVVGFDLQTGLPAPKDYRDMPFVWQANNFEMDEERLRKRLQSAKLILGDVKETIETFLSIDCRFPIGFIAFDLDYYSSTLDALRIFDANHTKLLPRIFSYFDDIIGNDTMICCEYTGELLAISEFNRDHTNMKIAPINGLRHKRKVQAPWNDMMYVCHQFAHPSYNTHIFARELLQLPLA
jgi:hypothetical protein